MAGNKEQGAVAVYYVSWTVGSPTHFPAIDLVIGQWGERSTPAEGRVLVSVLYRPTRAGGEFMIVDAAGRPADKRAVCDRALSREEVIGTDLARETFAMIDALWLNEPATGELRALCAIAPD